MTLIVTAFTLICNSGHKRIVKKFRTRLQAACLIIVSAYIHYHPQISDPQVKQLGAIQTLLSAMVTYSPCETYWNCSIDSKN